MSSVHTITTHNLQTEPVAVECHMSNGLPTTVIVGLATKTVSEAKIRLRAAFAASRLQWPRKRLVINLAPADLPKHGSGLDLAMAVSVLTASGQLKPPAHDMAFIGELSLDGHLQPVRGLIGMLLTGRAAGLTTFYVPAANLPQSRLVPGITVYPVRTLAELCDFLHGLSPLSPIHTGKGDSTVLTGPMVPCPDIAAIKGHALPKRALEIAAAGGHHLLLMGPPGAGKSLLSQALAGLLPAPSPEEILEITQLHSLVSATFDRVITQRPFRSLHHSASVASLLGSARTPGELSLAHHGVLFLDELPEFKRAVLEALRQPLEDHQISQSGQTLPARFSLVASANPCPCGYLGQPERCKCTPADVSRYARKLSGPLLDRIDLYSEVTSVEHRVMLYDLHQDSATDAVRQRIQAAHLRQAERYQTTLRNGHASANRLLRGSALTSAAKALLAQAADRLQLSSRGCLRTMSVARTIADLEQHGTVRPEHIAEALQFRFKPAQGTSL